nr:transcriptional regulator [Angustibacter aerolatus]
MPTTAAATTSQRLLSLLSLLQTRRDWPGGVLAERLSVTERTVRRDVDRLREPRLPRAGGARPGRRVPARRRLADAAAAAGRRADRGARGGAAPGGDGRRGHRGGRRAGADHAAAGGAGASARPHRHPRACRSPRRPRPAARPPTCCWRWVRRCGRARSLRFRYPAAGADPDDEALPTRRVQPHHLVARAGRWYLVGWDVERDDWRVFRVDRVRPRVPNGPRFTPRPLPGGDVAAFLEGRFRGASGPGGWPCVGTVLLQRPAADVVPHVGDGVVEASGPKACRVRLGAWSWAGLAASFARFDADVEVLDPPQRGTPSPCWPGARRGRPATRRRSRFAAVDERLLSGLGERGLGALTTLKRDGRPQLSMVSLPVRARRAPGARLGDGRPGQGAQPAPRRPGEHAGADRRRRLRGGRGRRRAWGRWRTTRTTRRSTRWSSTSASRTASTTTGTRSGRRWCATSGCC